MAPSNNSSREHPHTTLVGASVLSSIGLPGNLLIVILIYRAKQSKSTTTYLLLSLAIADMVNLLSVNIIAIIVFLIKKWWIKKTTMMLLTLPARTVANFTLAMIAMERYNGLVKTMKPFANIGRKKILIGVIISWFIAWALSVPMFYHFFNSKKGTRPHGSSHIFWVGLSLGQILPLAVVLFCYSNIIKGLYFDHTILGKKVTDARGLSEMKRLTRILIVVTLVVLLCNVPVIILTILKHYCFDCLRRVEVYETTMILGSISSSLNPFIYGLHSEEYRNQVKELLCKKEEDETPIPSPQVFDTKL